jgi:sulfocyanin
MRKILAAGTAVLLSFAAAACGGGGQGGQQAAGGGMQQQSSATSDTTSAMQGGGSQGSASMGELTVPDWMKVDKSDKTVTMDISAGESQANNGWNYNGYFNGDATIVVPEGYKVTINFHNKDQANPHSLAISTDKPPFPATFQEAHLAFPGAETPGSMQMNTATQPGQSATVTFTADKAGEYVMLCHVPAHATTGMWIHFNVSSSGDVGLQTSQS